MTILFGPKAGHALAGYGVFLMLIGLVGFLSNPEKAKTALLSGGTFGLLNIGLGWLSHRGWRPAAGIGLGVADFPRYFRFNFGETQARSSAC